MTIQLSMALKTYSALHVFRKPIQACISLKNYSNSLTPSARAELQHQVHSSMSMPIVGSCSEWLSPKSTRQSMTSHSAVRLKTTCQYFQNLKDTIRHELTPAKLFRKLGEFRTNIMTQKARKGLLAK